MAGASRPHPPVDASLLASTYLLALQEENGGWEGEVEWCPMITAQYALVRCLLERPLDEPTRTGILLYFRRTVTAEGGWGLHRESGPSVFVTTLVYLAARVSGVAADDPLAVGARGWIALQPGGVGSIPSWGRFWLALLGLASYEGEGVVPIPPEAFLLPRALPIHPDRLYCHTRRIYLAMAFLAGGRVSGRLGTLREELVRELSLPDGRRNAPAGTPPVAPTDLNAPPTRVSRALSAVLRIGEHVRIPSRRRRARALCLERIVAEQRDSRYQGLSPVNGLLDCVALWSQSPEHPELDPSLEGLESWRWEDDAEGVRFAGARSQTWDTAFALRALCEQPASEAVLAALRRGYRRLSSMQVLDELSRAGDSAPDREPARGGWCFSDGTHRWPVADCTAEAISAAIAADRVPGAIPPAGRLAIDRRVMAMEFLLDRQNPDGGFATYECRRGPDWLEALNPSEMFTGCMVERSYVECTASAIEALALFQQEHSGILRDRIDPALCRAVGFLHSCQRSDGSFAPSWGIGFIYAGWFAIRGFAAAGLSREASAARAARWILDRQRSDGGWGEHFTSCSTGQYVEHPQSQAVMTSWALLALMEVLPPGAAAIERGVAWLAARQRPDGSFPPEAVNGVFFGSAMLDYHLYRAYFPAWALARYSRLLSPASPAASS